MVRRSPAGVPIGTPWYLEVQFAGLPADGVDPQRAGYQRVTLDKRPGTRLDGVITRIGSRERF